MVVPLFLLHAYAVFGLNWPEQGVRRAEVLGYSHEPAIPGRLGSMLLLSLWSGPSHERLDSL